MKHVVSISLGTNKRDKRDEVEILGEHFLLERIGTNGDMKKFGQMFADLDGKVDALGVGGADVAVVIEDRKYAFREILALIKGAVTTPVVDGGGLKHTLERDTIRSLQADGIIDFKKEKVLLVCAVDRFGMAQALDESGADVVFGDFPFTIGLPIKLTKYSQVKRLGSLILPLATQLPFKWFYPTGEKQEKRTPKYPEFFKGVTVICGDWHYIRKFMPDNLEGVTIITQTLRSADLELLKASKARRAITTTPIIGGETFATNVMEGVLVTLIGKRPELITEQDYRSKLKELGWKPNIIELQS